MVVSRLTVERLYLSSFVFGSVPLKGTTLTLIALHIPPDLDIAGPPSRSAVVVPNDNDDDGDDNDDPSSKCNNIFPGTIIVVVSSLASFSGIFKFPLMYLMRWRLDIFLSTGNGDRVGITRGTDGNIDNFSSPEAGCWKD